MLTREKRWIPPIAELLMLIFYCYTQSYYSIQGSIRFTGSDGRVLSTDDVPLLVATTTLAAAYWLLSFVFIGVIYYFGLVLFN